MKTFTLILPVLACALAFAGDRVKTANGILESTARAQGWRAQF